MSSDPTEAERPLGRVAVLGLGFLGGSLCRALSDTGLAERVTGWSPDASERDAASIARAVDFAAGEWRGAVQDADLVVLALPPGPTLQLLPAVAAAGRAATIVDLLGLKGPVARRAAEAGVAGRWVGCHPMTVRGGSGFWASRPDLFQGCRVWLSAVAGSGAGGRSVADRSALRVERLWSGVGAVPEWIAAEEHDRLMAVAEHLPRVSASALASVMARAGLDADRLGPGGRDTTRFAREPAAAWTGLLLPAQPALVGCLRRLARTLDDVAARLDAGDADGVERLLDETGRWRRP